MVMRLSLYWRCRRSLILKRANLVKNFYKRINTMVHQRSSQRSSTTHKTSKSNPPKIDDRFAITLIWKLLESQEHAIFRMLGVCVCVWKCTFVCLSHCAITPCCQRDERLLCTKRWGDEMVILSQRLLKAKIFHLWNCCAVATLMSAERGNTSKNMVLNNFAHYNGPTIVFHVHFLVLYSFISWCWQRTFSGRHTHTRAFKPGEIL